MSILLSVNPPFAGLLVDGEKTIEWRKKPLPTGKAYIYETKKGGGCGKVIGEVNIMRSTKEDVGNLFGKMYDEFSTVPDIMNFLKEGKISKEDLVKYGNGNSVYACVCCEAFKYETPLPLSEFFRPCPTGTTPYKCISCKYCDCGGTIEPPSCNYTGDKITRPPQSWMYAEKV